MSDERAKAGAEAAGTGDATAINSQIVDAVAAVNAMLAGQAPASAAAMLGLVGAQTIGLGMHNAVARQQAEATINAAAAAATCARMLGAGAPFAGLAMPGAAPSATPGAALVAVASAQARAAIEVLKAQADGPDGAAAAQALAEIAAIAAPQDDAKDATRA
ncbi:MAG TPA: RebB family R body protein [Sphingomonas sp.]|nr:RebB family R body protein [Sphingomonas sp.]